MRRRLGRPARPVEALEPEAWEALADVDDGEVAMAGRDGRRPPMRFEEEEDEA